MFKRRVGLTGKIFQALYHSSSWRSFVGAPWLIVHYIGLNCVENKSPIDNYGPIGLGKYLRVCLEVSQSLPLKIKMISAQHSSNNGKNWQLSYQKILLAWF